MLRARTIGELALARNRWFTPHTWTNGIGLLANLHVAAGVGGGPYLEVPYDPPGWTPERRDFVLAAPVAVGARRDAPGAAGAGPRHRAVPRGARRARRRALGWPDRDRHRDADARRLARPRPCRPAARPPVHRRRLRHAARRRPVARHDAARRIGHRGGRDGGRARRRPGRPGRARGVRGRPLGGPRRPSRASGSCSGSRTSSASTPTSSRCSRASTWATRSRTRPASTCPAPRTASSGTPRRPTSSTARSARPGRTRCRS